MARMGRTELDRDQAILEQDGHPEGPRFGVVKCRNYDEHRWNFRRVPNGQWINTNWVCDECDKNAR